MSYKYEYILAIDPSGSFAEGKGTTGWVLMDYRENLIEAGTIKAKNYSCAEEYWDAHTGIIQDIYEEYKGKLIVVIEDYILYRNRSRSQINSKFETCRLIGVMQHFCWSIKQDYSMQLAVSVKDRWSDDILINERKIKRKHGLLIHKSTGISLSVIHVRDAFRHATHYAVCRNYTKERNNKSYGSKKRSNY